MARKYISTTDTAKMIRKSLKEAFPGVKFSVVSSKYSGGSSISIKWIDGPTSEQVDEITGRFEGSYFDGSIDYKGSRFAMIGGEQVHFSADFVFTRREYSDEAIVDAVTSLITKYPGNYREFCEKHGAFSIDDYKRGDYWGKMLIDGGSFTEYGMQAMVNKHLAARSYCETRPSNTAGAVFFTHDDGYSRFGSVAA